MDIAQIIATAQQQTGAQARSIRYADRLDRHLATLPAATRSGFLDREGAKWGERYRAWVQRVDNGTATKQELTYTAWDFTMTLAEIAKRRAEYPGSPK